MKAYRISSLITAILLVLLSSWKIFEDDIFWILRSGEEIIKLHQIQHLDAWSFTVFGREWVNHGWLTSVAVYLTYRISGFGGLVVLRSVLILGWFLVFAWVLEEGFRKRKLTFLEQVGMPIGLLSLAYTCLQYRFQLRGETFGIFLFLLILKTLLTADSEKQKYRDFRIILFLLFLWSNFHSGSLIFGVCLAVAFFWERLKWFELFFIPLTLVLNPYGFKTITEILRHANYPQNLLWNIEWQNVSLQHFNFIRHGFSISLWSLSIAFIAVFLARTKDKKNLVPFLLFGLFALVGMRHVRAFAYAFFLGFPLLILSAKKIQFNKVFLIPLILVVFIAGFEIKKNIKNLGLGLMNDAYATTLVEFVESKKPAGNLLADGLPGNYQLWAARDYPVFYDARDVLYDPIKIEYREAFQSPVNMELVRRKYGITSVIVDHEELGDLISLLFPIKYWSKIKSQGKFELLFYTGKK